MNKLVSGGLWSEIKRLARKSKVKMAAVAYVTSESVKFGWATKQAKEEPLFERLK